MNKNQLQILQKRYCINGEQTWKEVAQRVASVLPEDGKFIERMEFVPAGRILRSVGSTEEHNSVFNCSAIRFENIDGKGIDSRKAIMTALNKIFELEAKGTGTGLNFSALRPYASKIKKVMGKTGGVVSWMTVVNALLQQISQGGEPDGKTDRKGAFMAILDVWHPDIFHFLSCKDDTSKLQMMNISVNLTNDFMEAVENDADWQLKFPDTRHKDYDKLWNGDITVSDWGNSGLPCITYQTVKARELLYAIANHAWMTGEPGIVYLDKINAINPASSQKMVAINPCGESPMDNEFCNLGHINLVRVLKDNKIDYTKLKDVVAYAVRYLSKMTALNKYDFKDMEENQKKYNKIGIGQMGFADMLILMGIRYGSDKCLEIAENITKMIKMFALQESCRMVKDGELPRCFEVDEARVIEQNPFLPVDLQCDILHYGLAHSRLLTIAPTGSVAQLAGVSHGVEPNFSFMYERKDGLGSRLIKHPLYEKLKGTVDDDVWVTAVTVTPDEHMAVQNAFQKYLDGTISKTINLPHSASVEDVFNIYLKTFRSHICGLTVYRDGCRDGVMVANVNENDFCPDCGFRLQDEAGCKYCPACGYSKCDL